MMRFTNSARSHATVVGAAFGASLGVVAAVSSDGIQSTCDASTEAQRAATNADQNYPPHSVAPTLRNLPDWIKAGCGSAAYYWCVRGCGRLGGREAVRRIFGGFGGWRVWRQ